MSEYSTDALVEYLREAVRIYPLTWGEQNDAIIARLRVADVLYEAVKRLSSKYSSDSILTKFERLASLDKAITAIILQEAEGEK